MNPVFIFGAPRSGTSMLHWALAQHARLWGGEESDFLSTLAEGANRAYERGIRSGERHWLVKEDVSRAEFLSTVGEAVNALYLSRSGGLRWIEQTPHYVFHYAALEAMFPAAKFIHITRDGRQAVTSMQEKFSWSFYRSMKTWKLSAGAGLEISVLGRENFMQVRYESIVKNPSKYLRYLYDFIEEEYQEISVEFLRSPINAAPGREGESPLEKLDPDRLNWWPAKSLLFRLYCGHVQKELGYPLASR